ncbi:MAG: hypothetical protein V4564_23485 [Pseudomonadota bacterium]
MSNDLLAGKRRDDHNPIVGIDDRLTRHQGRQAMRDDFHSQAWADHHGDLTSAINKAFRGFMVGFERLNALQFDAPWRSGTQAKTSIKH